MAEDKAFCEFSTKGLLHKDSAYKTIATQETPPAATNSTSHGRLATRFRASTDNLINFGNAGRPQANRRHFSAPETLSSVSELDAGDVKSRAELSDDARVYEISPVPQKIVGSNKTRSLGPRASAASSDTTATSEIVTERAGFRTTSEIRSRGQNTMRRSLSPQSEAPSTVDGDHIIQTHNESLVGQRGTYPIQQPVQATYKASERASRSFQRPENIKIGGEMMVGSIMQHSDSPRLRGDERGEDDITRTRVIQRLADIDATAREEAIREMESSRQSMQPSALGKKTRNPHLRASSRQSDTRVTRLKPSGQAPPHSTSELRPTPLSFAASQRLSPEPASHYHQFQPVTRALRSMPSDVSAFSDDFTDSGSTPSMIAEEDAAAFEFRQRKREMEESMSRMPSFPFSDGGGSSISESTSPGRG